MPTWCVTSITSVQIPEGAKIIIPISLLNPSYQDPKKLEALIDHYNERYDVTILLADGLHRFNTDENEAQSLGDQYLETHKKALSKVKKSGNTVIRWKDWIEKHQAAFQANKELIEARCNEPDSELRAACLESIIGLKKNRRKNIQQIQQGMNYLQEELAVILTMRGEYNFHIYPGRISSAIAKLYELFNNDEHPLPTYVNVGIERSTPDHSNLGKTKLPIQLCALRDHFEKIITSGEISLKDRAELISQMQDIIRSHPRLSQELAGKYPQQLLFSQPSQNNDDFDDKENDSSKQKVSEPTSDTPSELNLT